MSASFSSDTSVADGDNIYSKDIVLLEEMPIFRQELVRELINPLFSVAVYVSFIRISL